jgi:hypothetical protein
MIKNSIKKTEGKMDRRQRLWSLVGGVILSLIAASAMVQADVPSQINFQGRLTDSWGNPVADGDYSMNFAIYDVPIGGTVMWGESQTVSLVDGIYQVALGLNPFPANLFDGILYLEVEINGETLRPRQRLRSTPFAIKAAKADAVVDGAITTSMIADAAVTTTKIVDGSLTAADLQDGSALAEILDDDGSGSGLDADHLDGLDSSAVALSGHNHWGESWSGTGAGLTLYSSNSEGLRVTGNHDGVVVSSAGTPSNFSSSIDSNGFEVAGAEGHGLFVGQADTDGVHIHSVGNPTSNIFSNYNNGFEVEGARGNGLFVGRADQNGVAVQSTSTGFYVESADYDGLWVDSAGFDGVVVNYARVDGIDVNQAGNPSQTIHSPERNGFEVDGAEGNGLYVGQADLDGIQIASAGTPSNLISSTDSNGVEVQGTEGQGLFIGQADADGVHVRSVGDSPSAMTVTANIPSGFQVGRAEGYGLFIGIAGRDGVRVNRAGSATESISSSDNNGFQVDGTEGHGLYVGRADRSGVRVDSAEYNGLYVASAGFAGVQVASSDEYGIYVGSATNHAGYFNGSVHITGSLTKGSGTFKIDHPMDPENKYLSHSFVESPEMKNIYDGTVVLADNGEAWVELPEWFEALNKDFRYQLTCIGGFAQVYIAEKITDNTFKIAGGYPGLEVSWQVTGIRQDPYAISNPIAVEEEKSLEEAGTYLHPEAYGMPETKGLAYQHARATMANHTATNAGEE